MVSCHSLSSSEAERVGVLISAKKLRPRVGRWPVQYHPVSDRTRTGLEARSSAAHTLPVALTGWSVQKGSASPALRGRRCSGAGTASPGGSSPIPWAGSLCASSCLPERGGLHPHPDHCLTWCLEARLDLGQAWNKWQRGQGHCHHAGPHHFCSVQTLHY